MKLTIVTTAAAALALWGCAKTPDQQFLSMCAEQKAHDPVAWASSAVACGQADNLSDDIKMIMINAYAELKKARAAVERDRP